MSLTWLRPWSKRKLKTQRRVTQGKDLRKQLRANLYVERLENLVLLSCPANQQFREITGHCSNPAIENGGAAGTQLLRQIPARYADGRSAPSGGTRPSAREISNRIMDQSVAGTDQDIRDPRRVTDFIYVFGQWLDHDLDLTRDNTGVHFDIPVAANDPIATTNRCVTVSPCLPLVRSEFDPATGTTNARQQLNHNDGLVDASQVYGSDAATNSAIRSHVGGRLKTDATGRFLPRKGDDLELQGVDLANDAHLIPDNQLFAAGDRRVNEVVFLATMHTLFAREHNRIADQIARANPGFSDEDIFQRARRIVGAEVQIIVFNEFVPAVLGVNALPAYTGFKPNVNPGIKNEFSTVFFRFGHSNLDNDIERTDNRGNVIADGKLDLAHSFFLAPNLIGPGTGRDPITGKQMTDIDPILKGPASAISQKTDQFLVSDIRNLLFGPTGNGGEDLGARDVQRPRDHGIPNFNALRQAYGLPALTSFNQITRNTALANLLSAVYGGNINNIDAFVGAISEDLAPGASVGPTTKAALVEQFTRLRDGDRFFFLGDTFTAAEKSNLLRNTSLSKIIKRNTRVTNLQSNVFFLKDSIRATVRDVTNDDGTGTGIVAIAGATVQLLDDAGMVLDTKTTNANGQVLFTGPDDIAATGHYQVNVAPPDGFFAVTDNPADVQISRGDINARINVDFVNGGAAPSGGAALVILEEGAVPSQTGVEQEQAPIIGSDQVDAFFATQTATTTTQTVDDGSGVIVGGLGHEAPATQDSFINDLAQL